MALLEAPPLPRLTWGSIVIEVREVDPELAQQMLLKNSHNRQIRQRTIRSYAVDMTNGDWSFTGEPITFAADGTLLDGQHRLLAIVESGATLPLVVVCGLENQAQEDTDRGVPRKFYDVLALRGEVDASNLASVTRRIHQWKNGERRNLDTGTTNATVAQYSRTLEEHPEIRDFVRDGRRVSAHCDLPSSIVGTLWWVMSRIDSEDADYFFERLADGQNLSKGNPIYELSQTLERIKKDAKGERSQTHLMAITIKAWNAYRSGDEVLQLKWRRGGSRPETFPEPI